MKHLYSNIGLEMKLNNLNESYGINNSGDSFSSRKKRCDVGDPSVVRIFLFLFIFALCFTFIHSKKNGKFDNFVSNKDISFRKC